MPNKIGKLLVQEGTNSCEWEEWDDINYLVPDTKFKTGFFYVEVKNFGWRSIDGFKYCKANSMTELLSSILPDTECTFNVHHWGRGLAIQNYHHDSNTGNEWYYAKQISEVNFRRNV